MTENTYKLVEISGPQLARTGSGQRAVVITRKRCKHRGERITRGGVTVFVKCGCGGDDAEREHASYACAIHGRCLPGMVPADLEAWHARKPESDIYHLCDGCTERELP
jgi:hypothetical protein